MNIYAKDEITAKNLTDDKWRLSLTKSIQDASIKLKICELNSAFLSNSTKVLTKDEKSSASNSIILFGALKIPLSNVNNNVVGKIFFKSLDPAKDNSLAVEAYVYEKVAWPLIRMHVTPHLILYIGYAICDMKNAPNTKIIGEIMREARRSIAGKSDKKYDFDEMHVLLTERSNGKELYEYVQSEKLTWNEWQGILFQLIYTIQCFIEFGFMHNDLHSGNIFVDEIPETTFFYFVYFPNGEGLKLFRIRTKYFLRIYDFDFSTSVMKNPTNKKIRSLSWLCRELGICDEVNWYTDLFRIFTSLAKTPGPGELKKWLNTFYNEEVFSNMDLAKNGVLCEKTGSDSCKKIIPTDDQLKHPITILQNGFQSFMVENISASLVKENRSKIYATPSSRKTFPPNSKKDYEIHLDMLKK